MTVRDFLSYILFIGCEDVVIKNLHGETYANHISPYTAMETCGDYNLVNCDLDYDDVGITLILRVTN